MAGLSWPPLFYLYWKSFSRYIPKHKYGQEKVRSARAALSHVWPGYSVIV